MKIVAIDGPAGSGKSSVSKAVAQALGFGYLDTGAAYRALAWAKQQELLDPLEKTATELTELFDYQISLEPTNYWVQCFGQDVTSEIRSTEVASAVSGVAKLPEVRLYMRQLARLLALNSEFPGVVVEGRDITTVVFPEADSRILLTASEEVRIERRAAELPVNTEVSEQVIGRDKADSEVVDFVEPAPGVTKIDSTHLNFDETVEAVLEAIKG